MPSLKDLRNRIASTKATQKITKAMQMVAASKLRRAQVAAEAARPFAERMDKVLGSIAAAVGGTDAAPKLLAGTGRDQVHLLIVATGERGLAGAFNSAIVRLAREHANGLIAQGKEVKILTVGRKGYDQLRRLYEKQIVDRVELRGIRTLGYEHADGVAVKVRELFEKGEFDVATLFYSRFKSVISQIPTAQQIIPPTLPAQAEALPPIRHIEIAAPLACQSRMASSAALKMLMFNEPARPRSEEITMMPTFLTSARSTRKGER